MCLKPPLKNLPEFVEVCRDICRDAFVGSDACCRFGNATDIDLAVERALIVELERLFDSPTIRAEESFRALRGEVNPGRNLRVHLDPLDGTAARAGGSDRFATSVAFEINSALEAGFVYHAPTDALYLAVRGLGAFANGASLRCNAARRSVLAINSTLGSDPCIVRFSEEAKRLGYQVEQLGSVALQLCRTATGTIAGVMKPINVRSELRCLWGVAAGMLLCKEAGAMLRGLDGQPYSNRSRGLFALNPGVEHELVALLKRTRR